MFEIRIKPYIPLHTNPKHQQEQQLLRHQVREKQDERSYKYIDPSRSPFRKVHFLQFLRLHHHQFAPWKQKQ